MSRRQVGFAMTMPEERTRALLWAGSFLIELARDDSLPLLVRQRPVMIARHFPTIEDISLMATFRHVSDLGVALATPQETTSWTENCRFGPLCSSTRLVWPD